MSWLDKVKQGAGQAKTIASQAAERAKDEAKELSLKRQIGSEEEALGRVAVGLVERGELSHAELTPGVERVKALRAELDEIRAGQGGGADGGEDAAPEASARGAQPPGSPGAESTAGTPPPSSS